EDGRGDVAQSSVSRDALTVEPGLGRPLGGGNGHAELDPVLHDRLLAGLACERIDALSEVELRKELSRLAEEIALQNDGALDYNQHETLINQVVDEVRGYGPLGALMRNADISEILINGPHQVFIEIRGQLMSTGVSFRDEEHLLQVIWRLIARSGRPLSR